MCAACGNVAHPGQVCLRTQPCSHSPEELLALAKIQHCPHCALPEVKHEHCNHVICPCGTHWCWGCGQSLAPASITAHYRHDSPACAMSSPATETRRMRRVLLEMTQVPTLVLDKALELLLTTFPQADSDC